MKRPRLKRPALRRAGGKTPEAPQAPKAEPKPAPKRDAGAAPQSKEMGLWFRASTRFRAGGYWAREKSAPARKAAAAGVGGAGERWRGLSKENRQRVIAVAGVLLLYMLLKFTPVPGVPCSVSAVKECAPGDSTVALVPADALLYAHVTLEEDTNQFERAEEAFGELTELERLVLGSGAAIVPAPSGAAVELADEADQWMENDLAVALLPGPGETTEQVFLAGVGDRAGAEEFVTAIAPTGVAPAPQEVEGGGEIDVWAGGFAAAYIGDELAVGDEQAVRKVLAAEAGVGEAETLDDAGGPRDELPEARFAEVYVSRPGVQRLLAGRAGPSTQLETFVDYGATSGLAAAAVAREEGIEIDMVSELDEELTKASPSFFSSLPDFEPSLADDAGERAVAYVGLGEVGPTLTELLAAPGPGAQGLAQALQAFGATLQQQAGVDPLKDLLPALDGQAALVAEPRDGGPIASLIVEGIDEDEVSEALASLQRPLLDSIGGGGVQVPKVEESDVEGVTVRSVALSPQVNLSYAVFDGKLVLSTQPDGIAQVRAGGQGLAGTDAYERVSDQLPERVSALVFLNLDELFGQVTRAGLVEDPSFAELTVLFDNASSLGLAVQGGEDSIRTELFLALD